MKITKYTTKKEAIPGFLRERFGDNFAQISTDSTLKLRSSVKDVARVLLHEVPWEIEELTKQFVNAPQGVDDHDHVFGYDTDEGHVPGSIDYDPALRKFVKNYPNLWDIVRRVMSLTRSKSRHASAYAIANKPIQDFIPTIEITGSRCTQYTATSVEKSGAIKYDFLRVNALNDISEALKLIQIGSKLIIPDSIEKDGIMIPGSRLLPFKGEFYDIWNLPEDLNVFKDIYEGRTETVFQFSTKGAKDWLYYFNAYRPDGTPILNSISAMSDFTALDRPGPLDAFVQTEDGKEHNMLVEYTRRAQGFAPSETPKIFSKLLTETFGILVYQEQVQRIYQEIVGCSNTEAEKFRSNVGKKRKAEIEKAYPVFMRAATEKYGTDEAQKCWDAIQTFSAYGFCQAHARAYSTTAYACAFLKHHFPLEWWCAVLTNAEKNEVNEDFWEYCGHYIDLPDIKTSSENYSVRNGRILAPLSLMNGIGETAHKQLCEYLPYKDIGDFCDKIHQHKLKGAKTSEIIKFKRNKKTKEVEQVLETKVKLGHSALHRGVVYTLIISGCMDGLFEPGLSIVEKLSKFENELARATDSKPEPVPDSYKNIDDLQKFQLKKTILPAYVSPLLPLLKGKFGVVETASGYVWRNPINNFEIKFASNASIKAIESKTQITSSINRVAAVFILSTRIFSYDSGKKNACEITFDLDGHRYNVVKWPDNSGKLPDHINSKLDGTIALVFLRKYRPDKPMTLTDVRILMPKIDFKRKDNNE